MITLLAEAGELAQNAIVGGISGVLGVLISQGFGFARSRSEASDKARMASEATWHAILDRQEATWKALHAAQEQRIDRLIEEQGASKARIEAMSNRLGRTDATIESMQKENQHLDARLTHAEAELAKERISHAATRGQLAESQSSLASITEERDELKLTLDEKAKAEKAVTP